MSTAGKVLVVLIMLTAIGCLVLAGGIAQLDYNWNQKLQTLNDQLEKTRAEIETTRQDFVKYRDDTTLAQEKIDREVAALRSRQIDLERTRSQVSDMLSRTQYDLSVVKGTIAHAQDTLQGRIKELDEENKAMADLRQKVQSLKAATDESSKHLQSLRNQFQDTYHKNVEMLGKRPADRRG